MSVQNIIARFRSRVTVYEHDFQSFGRTAALKDGEFFVQADESSIDELFSGDRNLAARFLDFLHAGFEGFFIVRAGEWVTYGWFSTPRGPQPRHLPRWIRNL